MLYRFARLVQFALRQQSLTELGIGCGCGRVALLVFKFGDCRAHQGFRFNGVSLFQVDVSNLCLAFLKQSQVSSFLLGVAGRLKLSARSCQIAFSLQNLTHLDQSFSQVLIVALGWEECIKRLLDKAMGILHVTPRQLQIGQPVMSIARFVVIQRSQHFDRLLVRLPSWGQLAAKVEDVPNTRECTSSTAFVAGQFEMRLGLAVQRFCAIEFALVNENIRHAVEDRSSFFVLPEFLQNVKRPLIGGNRQLGTREIRFNVSHQAHGIGRCQTISPC